MNIKVVEYSIFAISVVYSISVGRDLRHTNDLQDVALDELTKSLPLLVKTNIESHYNNNSNNLNSESVYDKDEVPHQDTMKEDLVQESMNMNDGVSRKASHSNHDKHRYGRDVSMIPTHEYKRQSFDIVNRNNMKKTTKELWPKQNLSPNNSRKARELVAGHSLMILKQNQKQDFQERKKQLLYRNMKNTKRKDIMSTTIGRYENNLKSGKDSQKIKKSSEKRRVESYKNEATLSTTSCVLIEAEVTYACDDDKYDDCSKWALDGYCTNSTFMSNEEVTYKDWMIDNCRKSCDACLLSLLDSQIQHEEYKNIISTFNVSLNVTTDDYAEETSWAFLTQNNEDSIFDSSEVNITSQLESNAEYKFNYYCTVPSIEKNQLNNYTKSTCYNFEVQDLYGDGMCCEYGAGFFSLSLSSMNNKTLDVSNEFEDGSVMSTSFCIDHDDGDIESEGRFIIDDEDISEELTDYPSPTPTDQPSLCDLKPSLTSNIHENHLFLLEVAMLSGSDKLQDTESVQYKAACWVLYDDPYEYDLTDESNHKRKIQRYILAVFYFATSPEKWKEHHDFLSSRSECDWNYEYSNGIYCDEDDNVIEIYLDRNNLDGTIVEELSGLRMLEKLDLQDNFIHGTIPPVLGRLSHLLYLDLGGNGLEGTIPPQLFNATNLEKVDLGWNRLEGTIHEKIGNLQKLSELYLGWNKLSGSIPDAIYSLKNLKRLFLHDNKLSSSISTLIGNLNKLEWLWLENNMLTGQIPSTIGRLSSLNILDLENNRLSGSIPSTIGNMTSLKQLLLHNNTLYGPIPVSLYGLPHIYVLYLQDNSVTGSVPDEFCERVDIQADCRNDVFEPKVSCSCCRCTNKSPIWDGDCADSYIKVVIDHDDWNSLNLEWSLTNDATGKKILYDGPYRWEGGLESYEACVAYSDCFSFNQISPPARDMNYTIYWNDESIYNGTFLGYYYNDDINKDDPTQTLLSFSYNEENQQVKSCNDIKLECYEKQPLLLEPNTTKRIMYNEATKISGRSTIQDISSPQSKALCWMLNNNPYDNKSDISETEIIQRYVLAILHFMSPYYGLFGDDHPPNTHECEWNGITCRDNITKIVTGISLSSENNQLFIFRLL